MTHRQKTPLQRMLDVAAVVATVSGRIERAAKDGKITVKEQAKIGSALIRAAGFDGMKLPADYASSKTESFLDMVAGLADLPFMAATATTFLPPVLAEHSEFALQVLGWLSTADEDGEITPNEVAQLIEMVLDHLDITIELERFDSTRLRGIADA